MAMLELAVFYLGSSMVMISTGVLLLGIKDMIVGENSMAAETIRVWITITLPVALFVGAIWALDVYAHHEFPTECNYQTSEDVELQLIEDPDLPGVRFFVRAYSNWEITRVRVGIRMPARALSTASIAWCSNQTDAVTRTCINKPGEFVSAASFTQGPVGSSALMVATDTLVLEALGDRFIPGGHQVVNYPGCWAVLGSLILNPPLEPTETIMLTTTGVPEPHVELPGQTEVGGVDLSGGYSSGVDFDNDGNQDEVDNCIFTPNPTQDDSGGMETPDADGLGDSCQCGDMDGDGQVYLPDVYMMRQKMVDGTLGPELCSVSGGPECDVLDWVVLWRACAGYSPAAGSVCAANQPN